MRKLFLLVFVFFVQITWALPQVILYEGKGAWNTGTDNLKKFLEFYQIHYDSAGPQDLILGDLDLKNPKLLIMPGGESWVYLKDLGAEGAENIRNFVDQGGSYLGICAGAFYATSHRKGGVATGPYGIGLLEGTAMDGTYLEEPGYIEGVMDFLWEPGSPLVGGLGKSVRMLLYGGPYFQFNSSEAQKKKIEIISRFAHSHQPAMIQFRFGKGKVFLAAPHFEVKEEPGEKPLHDFTWPFLKRVVDSLF